MCCAALGDTTQAAIDLEAADIAAAEADDQSLLHLVRMSQADVYLRTGDLAAAHIVLEQALDAAKATGVPAELQGALMSLAQVCRLTEQRERADTLFTNVEDEYREHGDPTALADALYWHAVVLWSLRRPESALSKWREEEAIRREYAQDGHLAECLYAQADALRAGGDHEAADPLFLEATALFEKLNMAADLSNALYSHGMSLRAAGRSAEALSRADEALRLATSNSDSSVERRAQGLRAMALADLGETAAAQQALDAAESVCVQTQAHSAMVWTLARRAYVLACDAGTPGDVADQLKKAHRYAMAHGEIPASRTAVRRIAADIISRCDHIYAEALEAFRREQLQEIDLVTNGGMSPRPMTPPVETELSRGARIEDDERDDAAQEE